MVRLLMLALYRKGRQADALAVYEELRQRLRDAERIGGYGPLAASDVVALLSGLADDSLVQVVCDGRGHWLPGPSEEGKGRRPGPRCSA